MKKWLKKLKKDERGLTLVELLAVVVILAIVAAIAFVLIGNVIDNSKKDAHVANAQQLIASAKLYEASGGEKDLTTGVSAKALQEAELLGVLIDPWEKEEYAGLVDEDATTGNGTVSKNDSGVYSVILDGGDCSISTNEVDLIEKGRDICD